MRLSFGPVSARLISITLENDEALAIPRLQLRTLRFEGVNGTCSKPKKRQSHRRPIAPGARDQASFTVWPN